LDEGLHRLPDGEVLDKTLRENRILLTHDLDFGELLAASGGSLPSEVIFRVLREKEVKQSGDASQPDATCDAGAPRSRHLKINERIITGKWQAKENGMEEELIMWIYTTEGQTLVRGIAKDVVAQVSPAEIDLFDELWQQYAANPRPAAPAGGSDNPLGSGLGYDLPATTTAAGAMVSAVLSYLLAEFIKITQEETAGMVKEKLKSLFSSKPKGRAPLTEQQLKLVKRLAEKEAIKFGIDPEEAEKMARALIGSLALTK